MNTLATPSLWRTLPPAGAPLPLRSLICGLGAFRHKNMVKALQDAIARDFHSDHVFLTDSGRSGLALALMALHKCVPHTEQKERREVLIPAYVSYSVPSAVVHAGFSVRLYDVDPQTLTPDYDSMRAHASEKTVAIVICHQFGLPFNAAPAQDITKAVGAFLVDDAAQVMGGKVGSQFAGCMGDVGLFSLSRGKPLTSVEGGIVLTNTASIATTIQSTLEELYENIQPSPFVADIPTIIKALALYVLRRPRWYTLPASLPWLNIGASIFDPDLPDASMSTYRMGLAAEALPLLAHANAHRRQWAERYSRLMSTQKELQPISVTPHTTPIYLRYPILPTQGFEAFIQNVLTHKTGNTAKKLGISRGFPEPLYAVSSLQPYLAPIQGDAMNLYAGARYLAENLITLPTHDQVRGKDFDTITHFFAAISQQTQGTWR